jgi:putative Holliday junction resolvase
MDVSAAGTRSLTEAACYRFSGMRALALDYGRRRIGVAMSDPSGTLAQPLETVSVRKPYDALVRIRELVTQHGVTRIVLGLPIHMGGQEGPEAREVREFGTTVQKETGVPVEYVDERWSSVEAERTLRAGGVKGRARRGKRDRIAAALLLQTWLARETR